jgi:hypothetical protein
MRDPIEKRAGQAGLRRPWHAPKLLVEDDIADATGIKNFQTEPTPINTTPKLPSS